MKGGAAARFSRRLFAAGTVATLLAPSAFAHRGKTALATVTWNGSSSAIEVVHRIHAEDAEIALAMMSGAAPVPLGDGDTLERLALYVESRFRLSASEGPIDLDTLGAEIEGDSVLVFQIAPRPAPPAELLVDDAIFAELFEAQVNLVNIRFSSRTRTLIFSGNDRSKRARDLF
ncbi:hypothetical protein GC169_00430 [bacterium]|nr:hypothetical protein [bacterium]